MIAKKKLQDGAFEVKRSKEHSVFRDILHIFFVRNTMQKQFYI